ncbi:MAG: flippase-like domain-containing protein [Deferribacteraceae bacterium]|jgi:uncharacterized protein (TIRG00374 family)|nr:flippase-like domain-containing protein [Deferribacteraceae bacterium]
MKRAPKHLLTAIKCVIMAVLALYLVKSGRLNLTMLEPLFSTGTAAAFAAALLLNLVQTFIFTKRYEMVIRAAGYNVRSKELFKIVNIGLFFSNFLPSGAGGDILRVYYLKSRCGLPVMQAAAITLLDRIFAFLGLLLISFAAFFCIYTYRKSPSIELNLLFGAGIALIPLLCILFLTALRFSPIYNFFYNLIEKAAGRLFFGEKLLSFLSAARVLMNNLKVCFFSFLLAAIGQILLIAGVAGIAYAMYGESAAIASIAVSGLVFASTVIPVTPGNLGMTEFVADILFGCMGVSGGAAVILIWRVCQLLFSLLGGVFYLSIGKREAHQSIS